MATPSQPFDNQKPDLDDTHNVSEAHAELSRSNAAAAREKTLRENGNEPVSVWIFIFCAISLLVGGGVMGSRGDFLGYDELVPNGYVTQDPPGPPPVPPVATGEALAVYMKIGQTSYSVCGGCHGADGAGSSDIPPLAGSEWVTGSSSFAAAVILHGLTEAIEVKGQTYNGNMPPQGNGMSPKQLAGVLTYIRNSFGNNTGDVITEEMAKSAFERAEARGSKLITATELKASYDKPLPGTPLDPKTIISYEDLQPVEADEE